MVGVPRLHHSGREADRPRATCRNVSTSQRDARTSQIRATPAGWYTAFNHNNIFVILLLSLRECLN